MVSPEQIHGNEDRARPKTRVAAFYPRLSHVAFGDVWTFLPKMPIKCAGVSERKFLRVATGEDHAESCLQKAE